DWDTSAQRGESSRSITSSSPEIATLTQQIIEMNKNFLRMSQSNQQVNMVNPSCETCGCPHHYFECQAAGSFTQGDVYAATGNHNMEGNSYQPQAGPLVPPPPPPSSSSKEVERDPETTIDQVHISSPKSTARVPSPIIQPSPTSKSNEIPERNSHQPPIPYPLSELEDCMALADLGASINLMPLSVWKRLMLPELVPTRMTLELANQLVAYPAGIAEDVFVQVGKFTFPADFVVIDYDVDHRVPLILGRSFLRTARALLGVHGEELILRVGDEKLTFKIGLSEFKVNLESKSNKRFVIVISKVYEIQSRESKGFSDTLRIGTGSSVSLRGLNLIFVSPIKKESDGSPVIGLISDFFAYEGGIESSRARKASISSKRKSLSLKGQEMGNETRQ
nr:reverse transcriptase domain-containing protein [Tanacetum cinerariifolium]